MDENPCHNKWQDFAHRFNIVLIMVCFVIIMTACQDSQVNGEYNNPYSKAQIQRMMAYHGSLVAKFDGKQWWFLSGDRWIKIENAGAYEFALLSSQNNISEL